MTGPDLVQDAESGRLQALASFAIMDTPPEQAYDDLTSLAARLCRAPMALLSLVDADRQWFTSRVGVAATSTPGDISFCAHALDRTDPLVVPDATADERFADNPLVTGEPFIRFYAGAPLITSGGQVLGTLCVLDTVARDLSPERRRDLMVLARQVVTQLELRRSIAELSEQRRLLDGVLAHTDVLVFAKDLEGRFLLANPVLEQITAVPGGLLGRTDHEVFPAELADVFRRNDKRTAESTALEAFDEELGHPDGSVHSYRSTKFPLLDENDQVYAIAGVSTDVTELVRTRAAHAEAERRWQALVENSQDAVVIVTADTRIAYANPSAVSLFGVTSGSELEGRSVPDFVPSERRSAVAGLFAESFAGGPAALGVRQVLQQLGGDALTVEVNATLVTHRGVPAVQLELRDVTLQASAQASLLASEQRFRAVFDDSPVAMTLADETGLCVQANAAFGQLVGREPKELIGTRLRDSVHPQDRGRSESAKQDQLDSPDGVFRLELRFLRSDGAVRWAWLSVSAISGPDGQPLTLAIAQDVTSRKEAEAALNESEADFAAIAAVAHSGQSGSDPRPVVVSAVRSLAGAATVSMLEELDTNTLVVTACEGIDAVGVPVSLLETSMTRHVWRTGETVFLADAAADPRVNPALLARDNTVSALWQPVLVGGEVQAILNVTWHQRIPDPSGRAARAVRVIADEAGTALAATRLLRQLELSASTDPLTGSLNRREWDTRIFALLTHSRATGAPLTVAVLDLDNFKAYNDTFGHTAGDAVLREVAAAARACLRRADVFARWGGEEFILALPDTTTTQAESVLDRIRRSMPARQTCSVGHTTWDPGETIGNCIARADAALCDAKHRGRNRLVSR